MTPRTWLYGLAAIVAALALGVVVGLSWGEKRVSEKVQALQIRAAEVKGQEDAIKAGQIADALAARDVAIRHQQEADNRGMEAGRTVVALRAKLAKATAQHASSDGIIPPVVPVVDGPQESVVAVQSELIAALDKQHADDLDRIKARDERIKADDLQISGLNKALKLADLRADIQEQAANAALQGIKQAKWLGRAEGFALGALAGYAGGRIR